MARLLHRTQLLAVVTIMMLGAPGCVGGDEIGSQRAEIVGGLDTDITVVPYQVSLQDYLGHFCGGTIVSERWIVSAAHCGSPDFVVAGGTLLSEPDSGQTVSVARTILFPGYVDVRDGGDISLIELAEPLRLNGTTVKAIRPLQQAGTELDAPGVVARVSGWGLLDELDETLPDVLQSVEVPIVNLADASADYGFDLSSDQLPAGLRGVGGKDSCQGDSGGPLVITDPATDETFLAGVVSWGTGCADASAPGMYARVTSFSAFLEEHVGGAPTAVADAQPSAFPGQEITLFSDSSTDEGFGTLVSYSWTQTEGPLVNFNSSDANPTFQAPDTEGLLVFELRVVDDSGTEGVDSVTIDISFDAETVPGAETGDVIGGCRTSGDSGLAGGIFLLMALLWRRRQRCAHCAVPSPAVMRDATLS